MVTSRKSKRKVTPHIAKTTTKNDRKPTTPSSSSSFEGGDDSTTLASSGGRSHTGTSTSTSTSTDDRMTTTMTTTLVQPQAPASTRRPVQCWALNRRGRRCQTILAKSREGEPIPIPYCHRHLQSGDYALKVVNHKLAGKCLVARYDLPPRYRMAFTGIRGKCPTADKEDRSISFYPPHPITGSNCYPNTRTLKRNNYNGVLNPALTGDILQYAACPGPTERQNIRSTFRYWGKRNGHFGGLEFVTLEPIPKNTMLCHWYGTGWWSARGIQRMDIGTARYPAPKRPAHIDVRSFDIDNNGGDDDDDSSSRGT